MSEDDALQRRYTFAERIAREAGLVTLKYFGGSCAFDRKSDNSPLTIADREVELLLRSRIQAEFPDDGIVGEEFPDVAGTTSYRWLLDPIDGTKSFICGVPLYTTLIGVEHDGHMAAGVIRAAALHETVSAVRGGGAWHQVGDSPRRRARVSETPLSAGLFVTSERRNFDHRRAGHVFLSLEAAAYVTRTWGDGYGYLLVATGRAVAMVDPLMNAWDAAAVLPILAEAGGRFTDWQGRETIHGGNGIGTNGSAHQEVLDIVGGFADGSV